jgi:hypothetical protein
MKMYTSTRKLDQTTILWNIIIISIKWQCLMNNNCIGGVIVSSAVDSGFKHLSRQTEDYKHVALRRKNKHWLALNQDNVSE